MSAGCVQCAADLIVFFLLKNTINCYVLSETFLGSRIYIYCCCNTAKTAAELLCEESIKEVLSHGYEQKKKRVCIYREMTRRELEKSRERAKV